jgi:hypothetical protein
MNDDPHAARVRDITFVLKSDPRALEYRFQIARDKELKLRMRLALLERHTARAWELYSLSSVGRVPWPPLDGPLRPPTLHEAMRTVLEDEGNPFLRTSDLAYQIAKRGLYIRRNGLPATASDIAARVRTYPQLFVRQGYMVRLRPLASRRRRRWTTTS